MKEYLTYEEKCILLAAISHERKFADGLINADRFLKVCDSLDNKFMYDRLFTQIKEDTVIETKEKYLNAIENVLLEKDLGISLNQALTIYSRIMNEFNRILGE